MTDANANFWTEDGANVVEIRHICAYEFDFLENQASIQMIDYLSINPIQNVVKD